MDIDKFFFSSNNLHILQICYIFVAYNLRKNMKWSELRRKAEKNGWYIVRNGSRHDVYAHPNKDFQIEICRHDSEEVKTGLFHKLKKQIGL